ncbi:MAG: hypothetical protein PQJ59_16895 [Spirochaetales bacterium]|nr:hypothetical protein [Spirochaetales bacterium]
MARNSGNKTAIRIYELKNGKETLRKIIPNKKERSKVMCTEYEDSPGIESPITGIVSMIDGIEYPANINKEVIRKAEELGIVICYGASDLLEFEGAMCAEFGACDGVTIKLGQNGFVKNICSDDDCPYYHLELKNAKHEVRAEWEPEPGVSCRVTGTMPCEEFRIMEDGELFGTGIVFAMESLKYGEN